MLAHELPLVGVQWAGLVEDCVRDADLADVVQLRGAGDLVDLLGGHREAPGDADGEFGDVAGVLVQRGLLGVHGAHEHIARLVAGAGGAVVLVRVHALVGELDGVIEVVGLVREQHDAVGRRDGEALSALAERVRGDRDDLLDVLGVDLERGAELVAAEAVGLAVRARSRRRAWRRGG